MCCANCVEPSPDLTFLGQAGHVDPLDGWRGSSHKRPMSRLLQSNESGFTISAINKYMLGSRWPYGATGLNTGCTSDAQASAKHNTQIPGPAIYTDNPDSQLIHTKHHPTPPDTGPSPLPTPHLHHRNQNTDTRPTAPVHTGLVKPKPNPLIHSPPSPPTQPRAKHIHISHTPPTPLIPRTTLIHNMLAALDRIPEPRVPPTCHGLTTTTPHPSPTPALPSPCRCTRC